MDKPCAAQNVSRSMVLSFGIPDPWLPTTCSKPALSVPVTALKSPSRIRWSCRETELTANSSWLKNRSLSSSDASSVGA